jgi:hypothetical protein
MIYLVAAYAFAIAVLGGYLAWSLLQVRELSNSPRTPRLKP